MGSFEDGGQGAMGGAMMGGAIGGPWGALIGGGVGFLGGLFGGGDERDEYQKLLMDMYKGYKGQQIGPAAQAQQSGLVQNRSSYIGSLEQAAAGNGPSAARQMMQQGTDQGVRNATAMAQGAGGRGVNMGAALRNAQGTGAAMQMKNTQNMGVMRAQEQQAAQQMLGQAIGQGISSDNQLSQFNAQQHNQMDIARAANALNITQAQLQMLMGAAGMAKPSFGTALMAGGANAVPGLLQMRQQWNQQGQQGGGGLGVAAGPVGMPSMSGLANNVGQDAMSPYQRTIPQPSLGAPPATNGYDSGFGLPPGY